MASGANAGPTVWDGPAVSFSKPAFGDPDQPANQDRITEGVWITRGDTQGIYNIAQESFYSFVVSPKDTEWAWDLNNPGKTIAASNYADLSFDVWFNAHGGSPPSTVGRPGVLHIISEDIYIDITFTGWAQGAGGGGAFSYMRSTPPDEPECPADIANSSGPTPDGTVDVFDLLELLSNWNTNGPGAAIADPTDNVDVFDLLDLLAAWGDCP